MHTTIAFAESYTADGAFQKLSEVPDQHIKTTTEKIYIGDNDHIIGAFVAGGTDALEARLVSPSLRRINPFYVTPIETAIVPTEPISHVFHPESPIKLTPNEALECELKNSGVAAVQVSGVVFLAPGAIPPVHGEIFTVNCAFSGDSALNVWTFSEITFPDSLPVANYRVVGARVVAATGVAFRFVVIGQAHRPGGLVAQAPEDNDPHYQRFGGLGNWFTFSTIQPPGLEMLWSAANGVVDFELYLDVIQV